MSSRTDMDRPATVLAAVVGLVLIAASLPFLILDGGDDSQRYLITWSETQIGQTDAAFGGPGAEIPATTMVSGMVSNVTVTLECSDNRGPNNIHPPVTITWELFEDNRSIRSGTTACTPGDVEKVNRTPQPDVGAATAESPGAAESTAYDNSTHTYRLEFTWTRPAGNVPGGLPVGQPTFAGRMGLDVEAWHATANEPEEATR